MTWGARVFDSLKGLLTPLGVKVLDIRKLGPSDVLGLMRYRL